MKKPILKDDLDLPSDKVFGFLFSVFFLFLALYESFCLAYRSVVFFSSISFVFLSLALMSPVKLRFLNKLWYKLGLNIGRLVSPVLLGVIFFLVISIVGLFFRLIGRDALKLKRTSGLTTYWVASSSRADNSDSFLDQF